MNYDWHIPKMKRKVKEKRDTRSVEVSPCLMNDSQTVKEDSRCIDFI